jgi:hypothetical protein
VTRSEIEEEVRRALPACGDVVECQPLIKGHGHQSFVLETSAKPGSESAFCAGDGSNPLLTNGRRTRYDVWLA